MVLASPSRARDHYAELGVPRNATEAEIRKAFLEKARVWHPDKCTAPDAADRFRLAHEAFEVLKAPAQRRTYDAALASEARKVANLRSATTAPVNLFAPRKSSVFSAPPTTHRQTKPKVGLAGLLAALDKDGKDATLPALRRMSTECGIAWPLACLERAELLEQLSANVRKELNRRIVFAANLKHWESIPKEDMVAWLEFRGVSLKFALECDCIGKDKLVMIVLGEIARGSPSTTPTPARAAAAPTAESPTATPPVASPAARTAAHTAAPKVEPAAASPTNTVPENGTEKAEPSSSASPSVGSHTRSRRTSLGDLYATYSSLLSQGQAAAARTRLAAAKTKTAPKAKAQETPRKHDDRQSAPDSPPKTPGSGTSAFATGGTVASPVSGHKRRAAAPRHPRPGAAQKPKKAKDSPGPDNASPLKRRRSSTGQAGMGKSQQGNKAKVRRVSKVEVKSSSSASSTSSSSSDSSSEDSDDNGAGSPILHEQAAAAVDTPQVISSSSGLQERLQEVRGLLEAVRLAQQSVEEGGVMSLVAEIEAAENDGRIDMQILKFTKLGVELNKAWWRREVHGEAGRRASALLLKWMARFKTGVSK